MSDDRMQKGREAEATVKACLERRGCTVHPYGQALLTPAVRAVIRRVNIPDRWLFDFLVSKSGWTPVLVDAKSADPQYGNYSVEMRSLLSARVLGSGDLSQDPLPKWYVAADGWKWTPQDVMDQGADLRGCCDKHVYQLHEAWRGPILIGAWDAGIDKHCVHARRGSGSGTPFVLIPRKRCRPISRPDDGEGKAA